MSDDTGSDGTHATEPREYPPIRPREQRQVYRRMLNKVTEDIRSRITEEDLHKIFSAPMEKRSSLTSTVNSPDIVWEYVPREQDGLSIPLFTASSILNGVAESALREKLHEIPGYAWTSKLRQPDGIYRWVVYHYRGQGFLLPSYLQDLPLVMTEEIIWRPSKFKLECASSIQPGSKLLPRPDFSLLLPEDLNGGGTVGFIGILDRGTDVNRVHVLVTAGHVLDEASTCGVEININHRTQMVQTHPVDEFTREREDNARHRPKFREGCPYNPCLDEICLIATDGLPNDVLLNCQFHMPIDCNLFFNDFPKHDTNTTHYPGAVDGIDTVIEMLGGIKSLTVYKNGAKTGLTTGTLKGFRPYSECNDSIDITAFPTANDFQCMVVQWNNASEVDRFSDDGDSGSLVYAIHDGHIVPLGIHFASDEDRYESYAHLLWYWCDTLETSLDCELVFCDNVAHS